MLINIMNTIIESIKGFQQYFIPGNSFKTETKNQFKKFVEELRDDDAFDVDDDVVNELISILEKKTINKQLKESIKQKTELLLSKLDENNKIVSHDADCEIVDDMVKLDIIEKELDDMIDYYNKHTKTYPMYGINWNDSRKKWRMQHNKIDKYNSNLEDLAQEILVIICPKNLIKILKIRTSCFITHQNKNIVIYNTKEEPLFDVRHIIKLLNVADEGAKYNEFKDKITHYGFKKNEYGGYIVKRFVPESVMYEIIMSSSSAFSKSFKTCVSKILCELRQDNKLIITTNEIALAKPNYNKKTICDKQIKSNLDMILHNNTMEHTYDNPFYCNMVKVLIRDGSQIPLQKYANNHVLYFFIITIVDFENKNRIFCKIGYTADIISRIKSLREEYKCELYLIGLKYIRSEQMEKEFHKSIKITKKHLVYLMQINGRDKDEIYIFDELLYKEFEAMQGCCVIETNKTIIDKFTEEFVKDQYQYFIKYLNSISGYNFLMHLTQQPNEYYKEIVNNYIIANTTNYALEMNLIGRDKEMEFQLAMRDKDIIMKDKEIIIKEKEIELAKLKRFCD